MPFDVKDYGAKGNGKHDDTAAIQAAIDAADKAGGGTVWLNPGTYRLKAPLAMKENVTLEGVTFYLEEPADG